MDKVLDLLIVDGDFVFDEAGEPRFIDAKDAIAQDIAHRVLESGAAELLIAEDVGNGLGLTRIAQVVTEDLRVRPGTVILEGPDAAGNVVTRATLMNGETVTV